MRLLLLALCVSLLGCAPEQRSELIIANVNVVDVKQGVLLPGHDVLISDGRITAVEAHAAHREADSIIDGTGKFLMPGLWDMHTHIFNNNDTAQGPNTWYFPMMLAQGITGVRDMWVKPADVATVHNWQIGLREGTWNGPRMISFGCIVDGAHPRHRSDNAATPEEGRAIVRAYKEAGIGFVKVYDDLDSATYHAIMDEARRLGMPVAGHTPFRARASDASAAGQRSIEHMGGVAMECSTKADSLFATGLPEDAHLFTMLRTFSEERAVALGETFRANDTWLVPTLCTWLPWLATDHDELQRMPGLDQVPDWEREEWAWMKEYYEHERTAFEDSITRLRHARELETIRILHGQGVRFLAGTDVGNEYILPGHSLHDELALLVKAGFTPAEALRTATLNAGAYMNASDSIGQVAPGMLADLLLLEADPLSDVRNTRRISAVLLNGRVAHR